MVTMGIVAMLSQTHGEYWLAGAVSATFALANAFISPQVPASSTVTVRRAC